MKYSYVLIWQETLNEDIGFVIIFQRYLNVKYLMKSGGFLYIEQTEAMAVIDVNTGKSIGKKNQEATY